VSTFASMLLAIDLVDAAKGYHVLTAADEAVSRELIVANMTIFTAYHLSLYAESQYFGESSAPYTFPYVTTLFYDRANSGPDGIWIPLNLMQGGMTYPYYMNRIAGTPLANLSSDLNPDYRFMEANFHSTNNLHEMLSVNSGNGFAVAMQTQAKLTRTQVTIYASMTALLAVIAGCLVATVQCSTCTMTKLMA
jgi:hypothetical protein